MRSGERLEVGRLEPRGRGRPTRRSAGPGRTGRRSARAAARRRRSRSARRAPRRARAFHSANGPSVASLDLVERREQPRPRRARSSRAPARSGRGAPRWRAAAVAEAGELADPLGDLGPDLLRRLPRARGARRCRRSCAGSAAIVLSSTGSPSISAAERVERAVDLGLELDDLGRGGRPAPAGAASGRSSTSSWRRVSGSPSSAPVAASASRIWRERRRRRRARRAARCRSATRRRSCSSETAVLASHHASFAAISSGRSRAVSASSRGSTSVMIGRRAATGTRCAGSRGSSGGRAARRAGRRTSAMRICGKPRTSMPKIRSSSATWSDRGGDRDRVAPLLLVGDAEAAGAEADQR